MLRIRSTPTDVKLTGHMKDWSTESRKSESNIPAIPNTVRDSVHENSLENVSPDPLQSTLPRLDLPRAAFDSEYREEIAESLCTNGGWLKVAQQYTIHPRSISMSCLCLKKNTSKQIIFVYMRLKVDD